MRDFFISYTKVNEDWARWIAWQLKQEQYSCYIQALDFVAGQDFVECMKDALENSRQMISVLSPAYFSSTFAQKELQAAYAADMALPVRVEQCQIPKLYRTKIYIDLVGLPLSEARKALIDGVRASRIGRASGEAVPFPGRPVVDEAPQPMVDEKKRRSARRLRVLFLGAGAETGLDLQGEYRQIRDVISKAKYGKKIALKGVFDVTAETLFHTLNKYEPDVFHFAGKQDAGRVLLNDASGGVVAIPESALTGMFRSLDTGIRLVILDTCYSLQCAAEIAGTVECAMGVKSFIYDDEAALFYPALYRAIAAGKSIRDACGQASAYAQMKGVPKSRTPQLRCRKGVDPGRLHLVSES